MCTRGKDLNAQLQFDNSIFPRFGRNRSSEKLSAFAKSNFLKTKTTIIGKESEAVVAATAVPGVTVVPTAAAIVEHDKAKNSVCIKTTAITISNHFDSKNHNTNGINETANNAHVVQRTEPVLHTDL